MIKMLYILYMLLPLQFLYSQTFQLGFRSESTFENTTAGSEFVPFSHLYISSGITERSVPVLNDLTEEIRLGGMFGSKDISGFDFSFNLKTHVYKKYLYVSGGIDIHHNTGLDQNAIVYGKTLNMLVLGIGYSPNNIVYIELSQYFPVSNSILKSYFSLQPYKLNSLTAFDFGINFNL